MNKYFLLVPDPWMSTSTISYTRSGKLKHEVAADTSVSSQLNDSAIVTQQ